jgi:GDPmannose 4,6-dehydratase
METKTALITGITGQDGSILAEQLLNKGYKVIGLKRRTSLINSSERIDHVFGHPNFKIEYSNMLDSSSLYRLLSKYKPDYIYNLAAQSHVRASYELPEETLEVIVLGTAKLLEAFRHIVPQSRFYQASSSEMFGSNTSAPQNEDTKFMPASPYGVAKAAAHHLCVNYRNSYGLFISCGILYNHESEKRGELFVTRKITKAAAKIKLGLQDKLYLGNLDAKRDWGYSPEFCDGMVKILEHSNPDDFVLATGETHTVKEFLEETFRVAGLDPYRYLEIDPRLNRPEEVPLLLGDYSKAKTVLGWEPTVKFKELVKIMYEHDLREQSNLNGKG